MNAEASKLTELKDELARIRAEIDGLRQTLSADKISPARSQPDVDLASRAASLTNALRLRDKAFGNDALALFGDPIFAMVLDLFARGQRGITTSVSSCCIASGAPMTTALRHIALLETRGYIVRRSDDLDRRRSLLSLSPKGERAMRTFLEGVSGTG